MLFLLFVLVCVATYMLLEHLRFVDARFWTARPRAIDYHHVHIGTKYFSLLVAVGLLAFEIWFAERILLTFVGHQGSFVAMDRSGARLSSGSTAPKLKVITRAGPGALRGSHAHFRRG